MSNLRRSCLPVMIAVMLAGLICVGVWVAGTFVFGIPVASDRVGEPAPDLNPVQEIMLGALLFIRHNELDEVVSQPEAMIAIEVAEGESADDVIQKLVSSGFINDGILLRAYMRYRGLDRGIEVGEYFLHGGMSIRQIAEALQSAQPFASTLTIPEGWRREQIAALIDTFDFSFSGQDFLEVTSSRIPGTVVEAYLPGGASLEGYLFPDTYRIDSGTDSIGLASMMLDTFTLRVSPDLLEGFEEQGLSIHEAVTLASIVEREAVIPEERSRIAAVFLNRLERDMKLEADPSVQYALGLQASGSWWKADLTQQDLQVDSPYNTYLYTGIPPGPIANPGLSALQAVAEPMESDELYFRALCDGSGRHAFARTYEQHLQNACP
ncbi:MAG: endolytic transglycosylase MltG [Anaerolineales bacterium]